MLSSRNLMTVEVFSKLLKCTLWPPTAQHGIYFIRMLKRLVPFYLDNSFMNGLFWKEISDLHYPKRTRSIYRS